MITLNYLINRAIDECAEQGHQNERLSYTLIDECLQFGDDGIGLLALLIGVANMGAEIPLLVPVPEYGPIRAHDIPDPVNKDWRGRPARSGKHWTDYEHGGLGIAHFDSSSLADIYEEWGWPFPEDGHPRYHSTIMASEYREDWLEWASDRVAFAAFNAWLAECWMRKYWRPAREHNDLPEAIINARIANSVKGVAKSLRGKPWDSQAHGYVEYKKRKRGQGAADRAARQVTYCCRVRDLLVEHNAPSN